jgi:hypothetical protein
MLLHNHCAKLVNHFYIINHSLLFEHNLLNFNNNNGLEFIICIVKYKTFNAVNSLHISKIILMVFFVQIRFISFGQLLLISIYDQFFKLNK